jgi:hypothetical protein
VNRVGFLEGTDSKFDIESHIIFYSCYYLIIIINIKPYLKSVHIIFCKPITVMFNIVHKK